MTEALKNFISYYLPGTDVTRLLSSFRHAEIGKNKYLIKPGQDCNFLAFIQEGCFRVYYKDKRNNEINTWFSFQDMVITDLLGFYTTGRASFYVQALENSVIYCITKQDLELWYKKDAGYLDFGRKFAEESLAMLMQRTMSLHTRSAEERYKELLIQPDFMQKIPLKYLASYLGITDTSLSRIRRKAK